MKTSKSFHQQHQIHGTDRQKFINSSINQWRMQLEKNIEECGGLIEHLI